ncbi:hypothetical protein MKW94_004167 [Papaver nudicaule]|uniref:SREBP regulating gene protein n=1 Tax=Papaver nudicaule TaxID=74823 RepID=A0AA41S0B0_PAPNU|nr:hypothetical protein [Papaver nudicaule]
MRFCWSFLQIILLFLHCFPARAIRTEIGLPERKICRNTVQGRYLLSDDNGHVCDALSVDQSSRCCPGSGEKYSCQGCNIVSQCCNTYEYCVSCCLNPARTQQELAMQVKIAKPVSAGTYASVFDFCAGRCRHSSESVVHENAYISDFHHCFSLRSNTSGESTLDLSLSLSLSLQTLYLPLPVFEVTLTDLCLSFIICRDFGWSFRSKVERNKCCRGKARGDLQFRLQVKGAIMCPKQALGAE